MGRWICAAAVLLSGCTFGAFGQAVGGSSSGDGSSDGSGGESSEGSSGGDDSGTGGAGSTGEAPLTGPRLRRLTLADADALAGAPLLVTLTPDTIEYADALPGGDDVVVRASGGDPLPLEIEAWDPEGTSILWVRLPEAPVTELELVYATGDAVTREPAKVWDDGFAAVWHLVGDAHDSTVHARDGVPGSAVTSSAGRLGGGMSLAGDEIAIDDPPTWGDALTIEGWVRRESNDPSEARHIALQTGSVALRVEEPGLAQPRLRVWLDAGTQEVGPQTTLETDWTWVAATYADGVIDFFVDGESVKRQTIGAGSLSASDQPLRLGPRIYGTLDEVRVSTIARSADWVAAQYRSMTDGVVTIGPPEPL